MTVVTEADISGTGATVKVAASGAARWVRFGAPAANTAPIRWGDSATAVGQGSSISPGHEGGPPPIPINHQSEASAQVYSLASLYVYVANGDKCSITWGL